MDAASIRRIANKTLVQFDSGEYLMSGFFRACLKHLVPPRLVLLAASVLLAPCGAQATPYVVKLVQQGNDVVATASGAIDLTGLLFDTEYSNFGGGLIPAVGYLLTGTTSGLDGYTGFVGPTSFGSGSGLSVSSASGDAAGIYASTGFYGHVLLWVPQGYVSNTTLTSAATWDNASLASLGVTPGTYTWIWGTGAEQSFTLTTTTITAVPEPAALGMFGLGVLLMGAFATRRRHEQPRI